MYLLTVDLKRFSAAHRLVKNYLGKCNSLHGHNYVLKLVLAAEKLNQDGLVIDFAIIRDLCNEWVQSTLDHSTLVYEKDFPLLEFVQREQQKYYQMPDNTSVECLAKIIYQQLSRCILEEAKKNDCDFYLKQVQLWESDDCAVIYSED